jgi:multidrug efflux system membrane fusion protein
MDMLGMNAFSKSAPSPVWIVISFALMLSFWGNGCSSKSSAALQGKAQRGAGVPATPVLVGKVVQTDVPIEIESVATVEAYETVLIKSQTSGELTQSLIHDGEYVKKGQELFHVDARTYQAQLNQARANLAKDESTLAQIEANLARDLAQQKFAQAEAARNANLLEKKLISQSQAEQSRAGADVAAAAVRADQAAIQSARSVVEATNAAVANAKVMLDYTVIKSPIEGRSGDIEITQGNVVNPSMTLTSINRINPIYIAFSLPEMQLSRIKLGQSVRVLTQENGAPIEEAKLSFIDNAVDSSTGTIRMKAQCANKNHALWPGEFVRVKIRLSVKAGALIIPNQALQNGQEGSFVFVVKPDRTVESRPVIAGMRAGQDVVVESGLHAGEVVVTEGQLRLTTGSRVKIPAAAKQ